MLWLRWSSDHNSRPAHCSGTRFYYDLNIAAKLHEKPHKSIQRETGEPAADQRRHLRLIDVQQFGSSGLRQAARSASHMEILREIRDVARRLAGA